MALVVQAEGNGGPTVVWIGCRMAPGAHALCPPGTACPLERDANVQFVHAAAPTAAAGFWAAATAAFNRRFHLTIYKEGSRWRLLLLWPVLLIVSPEFRQQFMAAVRGIRSQGGQGAAAQSDGASSAFAAPGMQAGKQA